MKALIGITASYTNEDKLGSLLHIGTKGQSYNVLSDDFVQALQRAGACAVIIPRLDSDEERQEILDKLDGLVFSGGADIDPSFYGEEKRPACGSPVLDQDKHDIALARLAFKGKLPILGVCRGMQLMNVALGGSLYQDMGETDKDALTHDPKEYKRWDPSHGCNIDEDSILYRILGKKDLQVNSFHHQAVKKIAPPLKVIARSHDGLIEGIEALDRPNLLLLQWHPEMMGMKNSDQQKIFDYFVKEAERVKEESVS